MLAQVEFRYRFIIFLLLLFANPWLKDLLLIIYSIQALSINLGMKCNDFLLSLSDWHMDPVLVIALMLCFWPVLITKIINLILQHLQRPTIKPISLMISLIWFVLITAFIFMQQGRP